jgi:murein DD-endopeptidase MepM/ murein hydrolase activator NlpD
MTYRAHVFGALVVLAGGSIFASIDESPPFVSSSALVDPTAGEPVKPPPIPPRQELSFIWPVQGPISSFMDPGHPLGIDVGLAANPSAPILAAERGVVVFAGGLRCCSYGYHVIVQHEAGLSTVYAHLSEIHVTEGSQVGKGERLGISGNSGFSTSEHLHFEVRRHEERLNPLDFLPTNIEVEN